MIVARRIRRQKIYEPKFEDRLFYVWLPLVVYPVLVWSASAALAYPHEALFGVGAAMLLLLFIAIHNAWDNVAYQVFVEERETGEVAERVLETSEEQNVSE